MISKSLEEYLKTMYVLKKQNENIRVTDIAKKMVTIYGMSDKIGPLSINLEKDPYQMQIFGESIENEIGKEVKRLIDEAYAKAQAILIEHIDKLHELAAVLIEKEVISEEEFEKIFED